MLVFPRRSASFALAAVVSFGVAMLLTHATAAEEKPRIDAKPTTTSDAKPADDLADYRTVKDAIRAVPQGATTTKPRIGYLGVHLSDEKPGELIVSEIAPGSPAAEAGLQRGDRIEEVAGQKLSSPAAFRQWLLSQTPGGKVALKVKRGDKAMELTATIGAVSRPLSAPGQRAVLGVRHSDAKELPGAAIDETTKDSPAEKAGLKAGDVILKVDNTEVADANALREMLAGRSPGDAIKLFIRRAKEEFEKEVTLAADTSGGSTGNPMVQTPSYWRKPVYRLAVVCVEFPDQKRNEKIWREAWDDSIFSRGYYNDKGVNGQKVFGSMADYYDELSCGKLRVEGKVFNWIEVSKPRAEYGKDVNNKSPMLIEATDKVLERDGKDALDGYDGIAFIYAGDRVRTSRGGLFWPHRAVYTNKGKRVNYFIVSELEGARQTNISVICHEFGHMLGLPDLYARPENPGSEGLSLWCAMSNQVGTGQPQHFSAWSKEKLGWLEPTTIDPTVKQKLILSPVDGSTNECVKVLARADGSEYFLLENRRRKGFDASLPGEGLLIWRVVGGRPILEESHGIEGPLGPGSFRDVVPFPSKSNTAFTPYTTPSSRSQLGGGYAVHITNIRQLADGRVTFWVGYAFE